ncbi:hypothetical protein [Microvirga arabica]|uniref:hypothetical protein n=1 Tax=Microvirga arabica TaxID=1128671 RepID=UPI00193A9A88|nr:hypothetical protein [Microvirga arabica]MBM1170099.1 hypothetical protein [Microvirga arabica]
MFRYTEEQRAEVRRGIVEFGIPAFMFEWGGQPHEPAFIAKCEAERKERVASGKIKPPAKAPAKQADKPKYRSALHRAVATYITAGPPPEKPDDSDQRNSDGEYGDYRDIFALPLGEDPIWVKRKAAEFQRQKEAEEERKAARQQPEPEFVPSPEAEEAPAAEPVDDEPAVESESEPEAACATYIYVSNLDIAITLEEERPEELPLPPSDEILPPQEILDVVEDEEDLDGIEVGDPLPAGSPDMPIRFDHDLDEKAVEASVIAAGLPLPDGKQPRKAQIKAYAAVIASALVAFDAGLIVSYSRNRDHYASRAWYDGQSYTYACVVKGAVDPLLKDGYLGGWTAGGGENWTRGEQSRIWAMGKLLRAFDGVQIRRKPEIRSVIRMRDKDKELVPFKRTGAVIGMEKEIRSINVFLRGITVELPGMEPTRHGQWVFEKRVFRNLRWETITSVVAPTEYPQLYRSFSRSSFTKGGRLYGYWQNVPRTWRKKLLINGEPTVELDFVALHPAILYAQRGAPMPKGFDPYRVPGLERRDCKAALNTAINAATIPETVGSLLSRWKSDDPRKWWRHRKPETEVILQAVVDHNPVIADAIGSDAGIDLMYLDSRIAIRVLKACMKANIPCLPVHDSFICPVRFEAELKAIMQAAFCAEIRVVTPCEIKGNGSSDLQVGEGEGSGVSGSGSLWSVEEMLAPFAWMDRWSSEVSGSSP